MDLGRRSRRGVSRARKVREEEEGDPDERARRVGGGAGKRGAGEQRRHVGPGAQGERATRGGGAAACWVARRAGEWAERWRVARGKSERGGGELGRGTDLGREKSGSRADEKEREGWAGRVGFWAGSGFPFLFYFFPLFYS